LPPFMLALEFMFEFELPFVFMFEPFMLLPPLFEFDMFEFEFDMFEFEFDIFEFEFDMFEFEFDMFEFEFMLALVLELVLVLVVSPPPQAERLATPANARSAKVLRMDRSPELL
jgi:hypothetical protein